jgi:hypothetical protein
LTMEDFVPQVEDIISVGEFYETAAGGQIIFTWGGEMAAGTHLSADDARRVGAEIGIDWDSAPFDIEQFRQGMEVQLEHDLHDPATNATNDDPVLTGKIALAHLNEFLDYYSRLERMEEQAKREHCAPWGYAHQHHRIEVRPR